MKNKKHIYKVIYIKEDVEMVDYIEVDSFDLDEVVSIIGGDFRLVGYCAYTKAGCH